MLDDVSLKMEDLDPIFTFANYIRSADKSVIDFIYQCIEDKFIKNLVNKDDISLFARRSDISLLMSMCDQNKSVVDSVSKSSNSQAT